MSPRKYFTTEAAKAAQAQQNHDWYRRLREAGKCPTCKGPSGRFFYCLDCRQKRAALRRKPRETAA